jgi:hypothetical protein
MILPSVRGYEFEVESRHSMVRKFAQIPRAVEVLVAQPAQEDLEALGGDVVERNRGDSWEPEDAG